MGGIQNSESIFLSRVEGRGFHVDGRGYYVEGTFFSSKAKLILTVMYQLNQFFKLVLRYFLLNGSSSTEQMTFLGSHSY